MNILSNPINYNQPAFCAKKKQANFQAKIPLTEVEQQYDKILLELHRVESDIKTQKQNLRDLYSAQDRYDYRELLKMRQSLLAKLKRIAAKEFKEYYEIEIEIDTKKQYNRFAPKLIRAKTKKELNDAINFISSYSLYGKTKEMLEEIIMKKKF